MVIFNVCCQYIKTKYIFNIELEVLRIYLKEGKAHFSHLIMFF